MLEAEALNRMSRIDFRLEAAFSKQPAGGPLLEPIDSKRTKKKKCKNSILTKQSHRSTELLHSLAIKVQPSVCSNINVKSMTSVWLHSLLLGSREPVDVGKECIDVCTVEFDASLRFMINELQVLHSLCSVQSLVPKVAAENCLNRSQLVLKLWRNEHRVLNQLLRMYSEDRQRLQMNSSQHVDSLERRVNHLQTDLLAERQENKELRADILLISQFVSDLQDFQGGDSKMSELRSRSTNLGAAGTVVVLEKLHHRMAATAGLIKNSTDNEEDVPIEAPNESQRIEPELKTEFTETESISTPMEEKTPEHIKISIDMKPEVVKPIKVVKPIMIEPAKSTDGKRAKRKSVAALDSLQVSFGLLDEIQIADLLTEQLNRSSLDSNKRIMDNIDQETKLNLLASFLEMITSCKDDLAAVLMEKLSSDLDRVDLVTCLFQSLSKSEADVVSTRLIEQELIQLPIPAVIETTEMQVQTELIPVEEPKPPSIDPPSKSHKQKRRRKTPYSKYASKGNKNRGKVIDKLALEHSLIGQIYQLNSSGATSRRTKHDLGTTVLLYFTQKYGLRKMAEEFVAGTVDAVKEFHGSSSRITVFGTLLGVLDPEVHSPILAPVVMQFIRVLFPCKNIVTLMGESQILVETNTVLKAITSILDSGKTSESEKETCTWTIPDVFRIRLIRWVEANSSGQDSKFINFDMFCEHLVSILLNKIRLDRSILVANFKAFDTNSDGVLEFNEFTELLHHCQPEPALQNHDIHDLWLEINEEDQDDDESSITPEAFAVVLLRNNIRLPYWKHDTSDILANLLE